MFHLHQRKTTHRADTKQTASNGSRIGDNLPIDTIRDKTADIVTRKCTFHHRVERDVTDGDRKGIHQSTQQSRDDTNHPYAMNVLIDPVCYITEHACFHYDTHSKHNTHHKENLLDGSILQGDGDTFFRHHISIYQLTVHQFVNHPQDT
jgi:hypothetical protein